MRSRSDASASRSTDASQDVWARQWRDMRVSRWTPGAITRTEWPAEDRQTVTQRAKRSLSATTRILIRRVEAPPRPEGSPYDGAPERSRTFVQISLEGPRKERVLLISFPHGGPRGRPSFFGSGRSDRGALVRAVGALRLQRRRLRQLSPRGRGRAAE